MSRSLKKGYRRCTTGVKSRCVMQYDMKEKMDMPSCICKQPENLEEGRLVLQADGKTCTGKLSKFIKFN